MKKKQIHSTGVRSFGNLDVTKLVLKGQKTSRAKSTKRKSRFFWQLFFELEANEISLQFVF